jgi:2,3-bisphosphoglycerate-dependent phosphoglycerate mutase
LATLIKYLENIPDDKISELEIGTGVIHVYEIDENDEILNKEIRDHNK